MSKDGESNAQAVLDAISIDETRSLHARSPDNNSNHHGSSVTSATSSAIANATGNNTSGSNKRKKLDSVENDITFAERHEFIEPLVPLHQFNPSINGCVTNHGESMSAGNSVQDTNVSMESTDYSLHTNADNTVTTIDETVYTNAEDRLLRLSHSYSQMHADTSVNEENSGVVPEENISVDGSKNSSIKHSHSMNDMSCATITSVSPVPQHAPEDTSSYNHDSTGQTIAPISTTITGDDSNNSNINNDDNEDDDNDEMSTDNLIDLVVHSTTTLRTKEEDAFKQAEIARMKEVLKARVKAKEQENIDNYKTIVKDEVKLHEMGWKDR